MRSPPFILLFVICLMVSGCRLCTQSSYVGAETQNLRVTADNRRELDVDIYFSSPAPKLASILPDQSSLTDAKGRRYNLVFRPNDYANSHDDKGVSYFVQAFGPLPSSSRHRFYCSPYTLSVAYVENGNRSVLETTFELHYKLITIFDLLFTNEF